MLEDLVKTLEVNNYGIRAYEQFAQLCYKSIVEQPDMAIFFLTLSVMAERFVNQYDESPLTITVADAQKTAQCGREGYLVCVKLESFKNNFSMLTFTNENLHNITIRCNSSKIFMLLNY